MRFHERADLQEGWFFLGLNVRSRKPLRAALWVILAAAVLVLSWSVRARPSSRTKPAPKFGMSSSADNDAGRASRNDKLRLQATTEEALYSAVPFDPFPDPSAAIVTCNVGLSSDGLVTGVVAFADGAVERAVLIDKRVVVQVPAHAGSGQYSFQDLGRGVIYWDDVAPGGAVGCTGTSENMASTGLYGTVLGVPVADAYVMGCGAAADIEAGTFFMHVDAPVDCSVWVRVVDGERVGDGPKVRLRTNVGEDLDVVLQYPSIENYRTLSAEEINTLRRLDGQQPAESPSYP